MVKNFEAETGLKVLVFKAKFSFGNDLLELLDILKVKKTLRVVYLKRTIRVFIDISVFLERLNRFSTWPFSLSQTLRSLPKTHLLCLLGDRLSS